MTIADLVVAQLLGAGVGTLFGVPGGGGNLDLIAAAGRARLPFVLTSTETAGAIAAIAQASNGRDGRLPDHARARRSVGRQRCGVRFPGRAPIVVFTDSQLAPFDHQRLDHAALMAPITKWSASFELAVCCRFSRPSCARPCTDPAG